MIDVWLTDPLPLAEDAHLQSAYLALLSAEEKARYSRFVFPEHRNTFLVAHALVRTTLSRYHRIPPEAWQFSFNQHGRPDVSWPEAAQHLSFNLSHTNGLVAVAIGQDLPLGVDVEDRARRNDTLGVAERFFSPSEVKDLFALPRAEQPRRFFDYWTLKEAYIKARGMGLAIPLSAFSFSLAPQPAPPTISFDERIVDDPSSWRFALSYPTAHHTMSVAAKTDTLRVDSHWCIPLNEERKR